MTCHVRGVLFGLLALILTPASAWPWGQEGHHLVGAVADQILEKSPATRDRVRQLLEGKSLAEVAVWADCAKGFNYCHRQPSAEEKAYTAKNKEHHSFHFADVPFEQAKYVAGSAGTNTHDVVQVLSYAVQVLRGRAPNSGPASLTTKEALWLTAHLVGEIFISRSM